MATVDDIRVLLEEEGVNTTFSPYYEYNKEADALTVYFKPGADFSKRLTDHVTLYLSLDTQEIVGCRIKGIVGILEDLPNYLEVNHGSWKMSAVFLPFRGEVKDEESRSAINALARATRDMTLEVR